MNPHYDFPIPREELAHTIPGCRGSFTELLVRNFQALSGEAERRGFLSLCYALRNNRMPDAYDRAREIYAMQCQIEWAIHDINNLLTLEQGRRDLRGLQQRST